MQLKNKKLIYLFIYSIVLYGCNNSKNQFSKIDENNNLSFINEIINLNMDSLKYWNIEKRNLGIYLDYYFYECKHETFFVRTDQNNDRINLIKYINIDSIYHDLEKFSITSHNNKTIDYNTIIDKINFFEKFKLDILLWNCKENILIIRRDSTTLLFDENPLFRNDTIYRNKISLNNNWYLMK